MSKEHDDRNSVCVVLYPVIAELVDWFIRYLDFRQCGLKLLPVDMLGCWLEDSRIKLSLGLVSLWRKKQEHPSTKKQNYW